MEVRKIVSIYISYKCTRCNKETILLTDEVASTLKTGKCLSCSHCGCKKIREEKATDNLKECMEHAAYRKVNGAIRQVR
ncbi:MULTISPECIES: hypothetical protein [Clostridium]|uniref:hypothetical protein n=1 Tax=Clostridium TaxID=1485 RepID=UPI001A9AD27D|nr:MULTISPECIES: hypothetical protein [Clostridium]MDU3677794.1 hypothetical protein [Clostridium sp.]